jgi:hypothetical protein
VVAETKAAPAGWASTVRYLQALYSVVAGAALGLAINGFVNPATESIIPTRALPTLFALVITLVPFYHGSLRHLESVYVEEPARTGDSERAQRLLLDFVLLFVEGCFLLGAAKLVERPVAFAVTLSLVCLIDAAWGYVGLVLSNQERASTMWAKINTVAGGAFAALVWFRWAVEPEAWVLPVLVLVVAVIRTAVDYATSWDFYFPSQPTESPNPADTTDSAVA